MSRTHKANYTGSKRFSRSCRNHGSCSYCQSNRVHKFIKNIDEKVVDEGVDDYYDMFTGEYYEVFTDDSSPIDESND